MARPPKPPAYAFRAVEEDDLPLIESWLGQRHWTEWWGAPDIAIAEIREAMDSIETEPLIVELDGEPIAYLQAYDPHLEDAHPYQDQPFGTIGLDVSIGPAEMLGKGHGPALIRQFCQQLFDEGVPRIVIDPHPDNRRAIRAYEKAGFHSFDRRASEYGPALMMARDSEERK